MGMNPVVFLLITLSQIVQINYAMKKIPRILFFHFPFKRILYVYVLLLIIVDIESGECDSNFP